MSYEWGRVSELLQYHLMQHLNPPIEILDVSQFLLTDYLLFYYIGFASNLTLAVLHCTDFTDAGMQVEGV